MDLKKFLMCWVENPLIAGYASSLYFFLKFTRICSGISRCSYARSRSCQSSSGRADLSSGAASSSLGHQWSEWSQLHSVSFHRPVPGSWVSVAPYGHKSDFVRGRGCFFGRALLVSFRGPCCFRRPQMRQPIRARLLPPGDLLVSRYVLPTPPESYSGMQQLWCGTGRCSQPRLQVGGGARRDNGLRVSRICGGGRRDEV